MKFYYISFRSVTYAQRAEAVLNKSNIRTTLLRTPRWMEEQGCGYALRLWSREVEPAVHLLRENQVPHKRVYIQKGDGQLEELKL
ncbi:MAG: DUF3343 domain-containing protein [Oscillospiraceae bacterium]|nr:DUF3343 domain-containing protein [Oscillospiraceae bacterium]